jgi:hypothetical protein
MTTGEEESGEVWVSWPDQAHFQSGNPVVRMMGMQGRRVRLVDLEVPSCDDHVLDDAEWARMPLAAVLDPQQAVDQFSIVDQGQLGIALVPHEPGGVSRVEVVLTSDDLPSVVVIIDPQGATNRFVFNNWHAAQMPPGGSWLPLAPDQVECVTGFE